MKRLKKIFRIAGLVLLILLASIGIGISGGVPVPNTGKREETLKPIKEQPEKLRESVTLENQVNE